MIVKEGLIFDDEGRRLLLRGVNLGGDSKIPVCPIGSETESSFLDIKNEASFVGRPFPLDTAQSHFQRLKKAGLTFLRFLVTWEAIEHEGPGIYDESYLAFLKQILIIAEKEGIRVFIDPHQDAWSRWTGGDGAPAWTMEKLGMILENCDRCDAAITKQRYSLEHQSKKHPNGKPYPKMIWPSNYNRYAAATMFSLFFGGKTFAPDLQIDGENVQDWLQNHYIAAIRHTQRRLKNCAAITGWGTMNEPHYGFIGHHNLKNSEDPMLPFGLRPSPWQVICSASGYPTPVPVFGLMDHLQSMKAKKDLSNKKYSRFEIFNPNGISFFKEGFSCPWKQSGVWLDKNGAPQLLKNDHFEKIDGRQINFADDFLKPFIIKYINSMKEANDKSVFFIEGLPKSTREDAHPTWNKNDPENTVNAFHWYDGISLYTKSFRSWFNVDPDTVKIFLGKKKVASYFKNCLSKIIELSQKKAQNMPCLLGEFGLAFDLNNRKGFKKGDYSLHEKALSMYYDAVDATLLHCTIWNYSASNTNKYGDCWNEEDLSIFSENSERAASGWKRPYPMATAGKPLSFSWNRKKAKFIFCYEANSAISAPTIIYLPLQFIGNNPKISIFDSEKPLRFEFNADNQELLVYNDGYNGKVVVTVTQKML